MTLSDIISVASFRGNLIYRIWKDGEEAFDLLVRKIGEKEGNVFAGHVSCCKRCSPM